MNVMRKSYAYENMQAVSAVFAHSDETVRQRRDREFAEMYAQIDRIDGILTEAERIMDETPAL